MRLMLRCQQDLYASINNLSDFEIKEVKLFVSTFLQSSAVQNGGHSNSHIFSTIHFYIKIFVILTFIPTIESLSE